MNNLLARSLLVLLLASFGLVDVSGKSVSRRTDKISENFKQLDLPPEEIDPNVAPPEPQKLDESSVASAAPTTVVDESINEIASVEAAVPAETAVETAVETADAAPAANAATAATTAAVTAKPKPAKPTKTPKPANDADKNPISRYCKCTESHCDCCRKFGLPLLPSGPGCARISYLGNDEMNVSLKFGQITLASRRISSKRARPICVSMPGGYSKFCGRVYGLSQAKENFKACLAFELRAEDEVEAQLPISCFKFGAEGLRVAEAEPLPTKVKQPEEDDDDDIFGFGAGGDDDEEDEDDYDDAEEPSAEDDDTDDYAEDDDTEAPEDADYGGFSLGGLLDELDDDEDEKPVKKPAVATPVAAISAVDQTREQSTDLDQIQSKDEAGTVPGATVATVATPLVEEAAAAAESTTTTTTNKKSKKAKKNKNKKKKKAATTGASETETDFAYELFNGILDFFN
ncbi:hypothetical protein ACLKA7_005938 [Drosophila subpalustris]